MCTKSCCYQFQKANDKGPIGPEPITGSFSAPFWYLDKASNEKSAKVSQRAELHIARGITIVWFQIIPQSLSDKDSMVIAWNQT